MRFQTGYVDPRHLFRRSLSGPAPSGFVTSGSLEPHLPFRALQY